MPTIELTDDEVNTLHEAFNDVGCDCPGVDWDKFKALGVKFGFWEADKPLTEEELKRAEEWRNSPSGKLMCKLMKITNESLIKDYDFYKGSEWNKDAFIIGSELRIRLPNNYQVLNTIKDK